MNTTPLGLLLIVSAALLLLSDRHRDGATAGASVGLEGPLTPAPPVSTVIDLLTHKQEMGLL